MRILLTLVLALSAAISLACAGEATKPATDADKPTDDDKKALIEYTDKRFGDVYKWYVLTFKCRGSIAKTLKSGYFYGPVQTYNEDTLKSLLKRFFTKWMYVIDFDKNEFRTFTGGTGPEIHFWKFPLDANHATRCVPTPVLEAVQV